MHRRIEVTNGQMSFLFFMLFLLFFGLTLWQITQKHYVNTMTAIMIFICLVLSMSFKTWAIIREVQDG